SVDATQTIYTFRLRPEACWSNGDSVTPDDFLFAWRRAIEPGTAQDYASFIEYIAGMRDYAAWRRAETDRITALPANARAAARDAHLAEADERFRGTVQLRKLDDRTLQMRLERPVAYWLDVLTSPVCLPLHAASVS